MKWRHAKNSLIAQAADLVIGKRYADIDRAARQAQPARAESIEEYLARGGRIKRLAPAKPHR